MAVSRFQWRVRRPLGNLEIELHPATVDAEARDDSVRELRALLYDFTHRQPEARRVVMEILAQLRGLDASRVRGEADDLDTGSPRTTALGEELLSAAQAGVLVARRVEARSVVVPLDTPSQQVLGPDSAGEAPPSKTWIGLVLVDQDGTPVPGRPYRVVLPDGTTQDGTLDSNGTAFVRNLDPGSCQIWCPYVEPHPAVPYTVQQGDQVSGVAETYGFDDYTVVWNDPANADLQSNRPDPHVLVPGDTLTIPEIKATPGASKPTGAKHPFSINRTPLKVRLKVLDLAAKPLAGAAVTVDGAQLTSDGTGLVETTIDKTAQAVTMQYPDATLQLSVGAINPADDTTDAGYKARLFNLGFLWDTSVSDTDDEMVIALQDFQAQYGLTVSGQLDDATKAQLSQEYGS
jgi:hypothetical protein